MASSGPAVSRVGDCLRQLGGREPAVAAVAECLIGIAAIEESVDVWVAGDRVVYRVAGVEDSVVVERAATKIRMLCARLAELGRKVTGDQVNPYEAETRVVSLLPSGPAWLSVHTLNRNPEPWIRIARISDAPVT